MYDDSRFPGTGSKMGIGVVWRNTSNRQAVTFRIEMSGDAVIEMPYEVRWHSAKFCDGVVAHGTLDFVCRHDDGGSRFQRDMGVTVCVRLGHAYIRTDLRILTGCSSSQDHSARAKRRHVHMGISLGWIELHVSSMSRVRLCHPT